MRTEDLYSAQSLLSAKRNSPQHRGPSFGAEGLCCAQGPFSAHGSYIRHIEPFLRSRHHKSRFDTSYITAQVTLSRNRKHYFCMESLPSAQSTLPRHTCFGSENPSHLSARKLYGRSPLTEVSCQHIGTQHFSSHRRSLSTVVPEVPIFGICILSVPRGTLKYTMCYPRI